ncbi:multiubiquitin domain-containing protein [Brevundimonas sp.]|uniref:multiubiquitin domain-containing protein n=1 Tax=Brevundimonas sp. TaxID=1871086 RepID=UPI002D72DD78|nr:multiubiquitin domain-containing protein [Brevundimonas sp.]HYC97070.1 multiubiquitin domain-containing protein [Brevundimonas sp.]
MSVNVSAHQVRVHIDREVYESPDPTTGEALYELGQIPEHRDLFREVKGDQEDTLVPRDGSQVNLQKNEHFYSQKALTILVNGEAHETTETRLFFEDLVKIAYPVPPSGTLIEFTVTYRNGPSVNPKGTLTAGRSIKLKNKMMFDVTATDRS